jgi:hypothetical protein
LVGAEGLKALLASCTSLQFFWADTPLLYKQQLLRSWLGEAAAEAGATAAEVAKDMALQKYRSYHARRYLQAE